MTRQSITSQTREYFDTELATRLDKLAQYNNEATRCYSLKTLPIAHLQFGKEGLGRNDRSDYIVLREKPVTVWIVGELVVPLFKQHGLPRRKASVLIRPLIDNDLQRGLSVIEKLSNPMVGTFAVVGVM